MENYAWVEVKRSKFRRPVEVRRRSLLNKARRLRIRTSTRVIDDNGEWVLLLFLTPTTQEMLFCDFPHP